jgi:hypothetical protein
MLQSLTFDEYKKEKEQATETLKKAKEVTLEKIKFVKKEKYDLQAKFEEDREKIQRQKDQLLVEQTTVKEELDRALSSLLGLAQMEEETTKIQLGNLAKAIQ